MKQTRNKITWFGAAVLTLTIFYSISKGMEQVAITALGGMMFIITGYQASEGFTKSKIIQKTNKPE